MRTKLMLAAGAVILAAAAYLVGYGPEHRQRIAAEADAGALRARLATADASVRVGELLGRLLTVKEVAGRQDFAQALELSTSFFDAVRAEAASTPERQLRNALAEVLAQRDAVTAALAKGEPAAVETIRGLELRLRGALGYPMPPEPAPGS